MTHQEYLTDFIKATKAKRVSVAERFRRQNLPTVDLLTGDKDLRETLPFEPLTQSQILSLYDIPFAFLY